MVGTFIPKNSITSSITNAAITSTLDTKDLTADLEIEKSISGSIPDASISTTIAIGREGPRGLPGKDGADYVLTEADRQEIAAIVINSLPVAEEVRF